MGNIFSSAFRQRNSNSGSSSRRRTISSSRSESFRSIPARNSSFGSGSVNAKRDLSSCSKKEMEKMKKNKYYYIPDNFKSLDQVTLALRESGLESSNLIIGIDFTKSNEWTGPTSYGPVVDAAVDIVERTGGQYHVLVIIADGQVTRSVNTSDSELSPQEENTINSIVTASMYPLSIVLVGVGDGPWEDMQKFDDRIPAREFDNFQFVNFTAIMEKQATDSEKEAAFALAALMEIPIQYKAARELGLLGRRTGKAKKVVPRPPPIPYSRRMSIPTQDQSSFSGSPQDERNQVCPVCLTGTKDMAFGCGHMTCRECGPKLSACPICRQRITSRIRLYT